MCWFKTVAEIFWEIACLLIITYYFKTPWWIWDPEVRALLIYSQYLELLLPLINGQSFHYSEERPGVLARSLSWHLEYAWPMSRSPSPLITIYASVISLCILSKWASHNTTLGLLFWKLSLMTLRNRNILPYSLQVRSLALRYWRDWFLWKIWGRSMLGLASSSFECR